MHQFWSYITYYLEFLPALSPGLLQFPQSKDIHHYQRPTKVLSAPPFLFKLWNNMQDRVRNLSTVVCHRPSLMMLAQHSAAESWHMATRTHGWEYHRRGRRSILWQHSAAPTPAQHSTEWICLRSLWYYYWTVTIQWLFFTFKKFAYYYWPELGISLGRGTLGLCLPKHR